MCWTCFASMEAAPRARRLLLGACAVAVLMAIAVANAGSGEAASVIGQAKCADCTRKNVNAEAAFNGLKVAIKCKNSNGEYESKAVGELQSSGAFSVPVSVHPADCVAQLHSAAGTPCPGQEPSRIAPLSDGTFVAVPGNTQRQASSAVCGSVTICGGSVMKYFHEHFHKKEEKQEPSKPEPKPKPQPEYQPPTPTYGLPTTPIYHPPATHTHLADHLHKEDHEMEHFFNHFHKKPVVPPKPEPEPKPQPEHQPPTPTYGSPTPTTGSPTPGSDHAPHMFDHYYKGHHHHHFFDYFHKKPVPPEPKPQPKPQPEYQPPVPTFASPPPLYHPPANLLP